MREIKFQYIYELLGVVCRPTLTLEQIEEGLAAKGSFPSNAKIIAKRQYTGLKDCKGVEIYEGDILNICYESDEFIFDANYSVSISESGVKFQFLNLAWSHHCDNQYPILTTLSVSDYGLVRRDYRGEWDDCGLCVSEQDGYKYSNIFKVMGNIHENPELLNAR